MKKHKTYILLALLVGMTLFSCRQKEQKPAPYHYLITDTLQHESSRKPAMPSSAKQEPYSKTYEDAYEKGYEHGYDEMPDYPDDRMTEEERQAFEDGIEEGLDDSYDGFE